MPPAATNGKTRVTLFFGARAKSQSVGEKRSRLVCVFATDDVFQQPLHITLSWIKTSSNGVPNDLNRLHLLNRTFQAVVFPEQEIPGSEPSGICVCESLVLVHWQKGKGELCFHTLSRLLVLDCEEHLPLLSKYPLQLWASSTAHYQ